MASDDPRPRRIAVVLFNLGGPLKQDDVRPFLLNLFGDPAIISAPSPLRAGLAWLIATHRAKAAQANYALIGGGSPLLAETTKQAKALEDALARRLTGAEIKSFIAMRYWEPLVEGAAAAVRAWTPDEIVLLPLYPQFSTTTTGSSLAAWRAAAPDLPARTVCCYPTNDAFLDAHAALIRTAWENAGKPDRVRLLFSAHGLPERVINRGDPYQWQIEQTALGVAARLPELADWVVCYQSRVGRLKWIGPSTLEEINRAAADGKGVLLCPVSFVSEHVETLVELDIEYAEHAKAKGVAPYIRTPALGTSPGFITALSDLVVEALNGEPGLKVPGGARLCGAEHGACPCRAEGAPS